MSTRRRPKPQETKPAPETPPKGNPVALVAALVAITVVMAAVYYYTKSGGNESFTGGAGSVAPDFSLMDTEGVSISLAQHRGQVIILDFMGTWCIPCKTQVGHLRDVQSSYAVRGVKIISIDSDSTQTDASLHAYKLENGATWSFAVDRAGASVQYGVESIPTVVVIAPDGTIAKRNVGVITASALEEAIEPLLLG